MFFDYFLNFVIFLCNLKVGSLFDSDNSDTKIIIYFVSRFFSIFFGYLKVSSLFGSDNSEPKIIFRFFFLNFCHFFWFYFKVGSLI